MPAHVACCLLCGPLTTRKCRSCNAYASTDPQAERVHPAGLMLLSSWQHAILVLRVSVCMQVRELVANVGLEVTFLKRVRIGGFRLPKDLSLGGMRPLKPNEVRRVLDRGAQSL